MEIKNPQSDSLIRQKKKIMKIITLKKNEKIKKKMTKLALTFTFCLILLNVVFSQDIIKNCDDFVSVRLKDPSANYVFQSDIDCESNPGFKVIGDINQEFMGRIDGRGFRLFNININSNEDENIGIFASARQATFIDFTISVSQNFIFPSCFFNLNKKLFFFLGYIYNNRLNNHKFGRTSRDRTRMFIPKY